MPLSNSYPHSDALQLSEAAITNDSSNLCDFSTTMHWQVLSISSLAFHSQQLLADTNASSPLFLISSMFSLGSFHDELFDCHNLSITTSGPRKFILTPEVLAK